jgi:5-methylcytosine-specific restriction protein B
LTEFYQSFDEPRHINLGAYFGVIGTLLAKKISDAQIIKEENDKTYNYVKNKLLNIHYFDLITGYRRRPNYFLIGSKYGEKNNVDMFPQMLENNVISVGFAPKLDLSDFYLTDVAEISEYLKDQGENQNSINALRHFLSLKIGDRIAVKSSGSPKAGKGFLSIIGICEVVKDDNGDVYKYDPENLFHTINVKFLEASENKEFELGGYGSTIHHLSNESHIRLIFGESNSSIIDDSIDIKTSITKKENMHPLNTIFYGPPGTGKTYHTVLRAAEIIEDRKIQKYEDALKIFKENLGNRIEFITFHQNYSYEDFIQGLRPETENNSSLTFKKHDGVFKKIVDRAINNPYYIPVGTILKDYKVIKSNSDVLELWSEKTNSIRYVPLQLVIDLYEGILSGKITLEDIKKRKDLDLPALINSKVEKYFFGIEGTLYNICEFLLEKKKSNEKQNYVIVIDEINRANISRVFGELITLIEPDKRSEGDIPMTVTLPSGDSFMVPSNLYIIGTMNTADKSIALLDIALRRRFNFEPMYPQYEIEGDVIHNADVLKKINDYIVKSKGHDFQIGHAYFMRAKSDLKTVMNQKVIPLLMEYYMNDSSEVKNILLSAGLKFDANDWPLKVID